MNISQHKLRNPSHLNVLNFQEHKRVQFNFSQEINYGLMNNIKIKFKN